KSTLVGRLLHETKSLPEGKLEMLKAVSARRGMPFEWSFLLDALQTERDQGITIDTSQIRFRTPSRDIVLIDAPGHAEFLRNMITGAAQADAAILIVDATEGVREQTRQHGYLLHLLGLRQEAVDGFSPAPTRADLALRLPVQAVYKFDDRRIIAGRLESGRIVLGDDIVVMPSGKRARVKSIEAWPLHDDARAPSDAMAGQSI